MKLLPGSWLLLVALVAPAAGAYELQDSLEGSTAGNQIGGSLGPDGWTVTSRTDLIWYAIPRLVSGSIKFTITNASLANLTVADNELFAMYEAGYGIEEPIDYSPDYRNNFYKAMIRVYGTEEPERTGLQKLMFGICNAGNPGYSTGDGCPCADAFFEEKYGGNPTWDGSPVTLEVTWGDGHAKLFKNGGLVKDIDYSSAGPFGPDNPHFSLGTSRAKAVSSAGLPVGAIFSDLVVSGVEGPLAPACVLATAGAAGADASGGSSGAGGSGGAAGDAGGSSGSPAAAGKGGIGGGWSSSDPTATGDSDAREPLAGIDGGCACRSASGQSPRALGWFAAALLLAMRRRRL